MSKKRAIVLSGGGARAAYQVGVIRGIYEITQKKKNLFSIITGNSAGAINAMFLASGCDNWDESTSKLVDLWSNLKPQDVFDLRSRMVSELGLKWMGGLLFGGLTKKGSHINHLLDTTPLRSLLEKSVDFNKVNQQILNGNLSGIALATTNYNTGASVIFCNSSEKITPWKRSNRFSEFGPLSLEHLIASTAIPIFFPPVKINESYFGDGCIRQTTPLSPAIHLKADKIFTIGIRFNHAQEKIKDKTFQSIPEPAIGQIAGILLNAIFLDSLDSDVERLQRINDLTHDKTHFKKIDYHMMKPSEDLGKLSHNLNENLPTTLRYLLKGIGVSGKDGLDLLSYLAFDSSYTKKLISLGLKDAYNYKNEILHFFNDDV